MTALDILAVWLFTIVVNEAGPNLRNAWLEELWIIQTMF